MVPILLLTRAYADAAGRPAARRPASYIDAYASAAFKV